MRFYRVLFVYTIYTRCRATFSVLINLRAARTSHTYIGVPWCCRCVTAVRLQTKIIICTLLDVLIRGENAPENSHVTRKPLITYRLALPSYFFPYQNTRYIYVDGRRINRAARYAHSENTRTKDAWIFSSCPSRDLYSCACTAHMCVYTHPKSCITKKWRYTLK